jgi:hypothetical protein
MIADLVGIVRVGAVVEPIPALGFVVASACGDIDPARVAKDRGSRVCPTIVDARCYQRATAADTFGIDVSISLVDACIGEGAHDTAGSTAYCSPGQGADGGGDEPASGHHRPDAGDGEHAETGQQPTGAADNGADACTCTGAFHDIVVDIGAMMAIGIIGDDGNVAPGNARILQRAHCGLGLLVAIEEPCNCSHKLFSLGSDPTPDPQPMN